LVAISGADSHVGKPSYQRITTAKDWARIWATHLGTSVDDAYRQLLEVDFQRCLIVVIFQGEAINVRGIQIVSFSETLNSITIRFDELTYQTAGDSNNDPPRRPYAFVIIPTTSKTIVVEENVQNYKDAPLEWKQIARLPATQSVAPQNSKR
jgi:hypothetical protein